MTLLSFQTFINQKGLFSTEQKILLAISGGVDSVVMAELFNKAGYSFAMAHCNFELRGIESDIDEKFVKQLANNYKVPFYTKHFETEKYAKEKNISIQMAARELRYQWLEKIRKIHHFDYIAVAHHQDDVVETFLINFIRGTGIAGLHGILPKQNNIIRPLLFASKKQILEFDRKEKLTFREDVSNQSQKYVRNKIRHQLIPLLKEINPNINETILENAERLGQAEQIYRGTIEQKRKELINVQNDKILIPIAALKKLHPIETYLYEFLNPYHLNADVVKDIITSLDGISGKQFFSDTHRLIKDRDNLIITTRQNNNKSEEIKISKYQTAIEQPLKLCFKIVDSPDFNIPISNTYASLDYDKLKFPLTIRKWTKGDNFYPFGMKQRKKLSDFFIDNKVPINEKENTFVIVSNNKIIWVVGHRIDDRFRVTDNTRKIYFVELY